MQGWVSPARRRNHSARDRHRSKEYRISNRPSAGPNPSGPYFLMRGFADPLGPVGGDHLGMLVPVARRIG